MCAGRLACGIRSAGQYGRVPGGGAVLLRRPPAIREHSPERPFVRHVRSPQRSRPPAPQPGRAVHGRGLIYLATAVFLVGVVLVLKPIMETRRRPFRD